MCFTVRCAISVALRLKCNERVMLLLLPQGERCVRLHWMYRAVDTPLAAGPKESTDKEPYVAQLPSGDHLIHPRMLWVCGSEEDNDRYNNCFPLASIDRCGVMSVVVAVLSGLNAVLSAQRGRCACQCERIVDFWVRCCWLPNIISGRCCVDAQNHTNLILEKYHCYECNRHVFMLLGTCSLLLAGRCAWYTSSQAAGTQQRTQTLRCA